MPRNPETYKPMIDLEKGLCPIAIIPELLPNEYFLLITEIAAPNVLPYYMISNYGRIWHKYLHHFMRTSWDCINYMEGYRIASLACKDGKNHSFRVHRLLMLTHRYFPGCENMMVNHIDGVKTHNYIDFPGKGDNLEWCDGSYNEKEAFRLGLKKPKIGVDHPLSTMSEEDVIKLCQILEDKHNGKNNMRYRDIMKELKVSENQINYIKNINGWIHISKNFNI